MLENISFIISKAIKEQKWLSVSYKNKEEKVTSFWCAIHDINIMNKTFIVTNYNFNKINATNNGLQKSSTLRFEGIISAQIVEHTSYKQPPELLTKIEQNLSKLEWLNFDFFNEKVLVYLKDAMKYDSTPYIKKTDLVKGIDTEILEKSLINDGKYLLDHFQLAQIAETLNDTSKNKLKKMNKITDLVINLLAINTKKGLFIVAYKNITFNPEDSSLILSEEEFFNYEFLNEQTGQKHNLKNYLDIDTEEFIGSFKENFKNCCDMLAKTLRRGESLDENPYILEQLRTNDQYIEKEFNDVVINKKNGIISKPLDVFFGNINSTTLNSKKKPTIITYNEMNVNQLRCIHNALKQPVTYVQGPPGTGKTSCIVNLLISALFNSKTVLVSTNNNKPINDILQKINNIKKGEYFVNFPILRLGNNDNTLKSLRDLEKLIQKHSETPIFEKALQKSATTNTEVMKELNHIIDSYEKKLYLNEELDAAKSFYNTINNSFRSIIIYDEIKKLENQSNLMENITEDEIKNKITKADETFLNWLNYTTIKKLKLISKPDFEELYTILKIADDNKLVTQFNKYLKNTQNLNKLLKIFPIIFTTNQSAHRLGAAEPIFDLTIIDEAGQCNIGHALFPIIKGNSLLLVGDQNQLKPVVTLPTEINDRLMSKHNIPSVYNYCENSIILTMQKVDPISKFILLNEHYRCHPSIINFSNKKYYNSKLSIKTPSQKNEPAIQYINIKNVLKNDVSKNISPNEVEVLIKELQGQDHKNVGIITPFRNQANYLKECLDYKRIKVDQGTVHTFQGDEKDTIYLSLAIANTSSDKTFNWLKNNKELINVATTRAKKKLVIIGDFDEIEKRSSEDNDLSELIKYVKTEGRSLENVTTRTDTPYANGGYYRQYNSVRENEFFDLISQLVTTIQGKLEVKDKVKMINVLDDVAINHSEREYLHKGEFDFVVYNGSRQNQNPVLVIELDGVEHKTDPETIRKDKIKETLCKRKNITLYRIPNDYSRRYITVKNMLRRYLVSS